MRAAPFYVHSGEWSKLCFVLIPDTSFVERIDQPPCRTPQLVTAFLCLAKTKQISSCPIANCVSPARKCSCDVIFLHLQNDDEEWCHLHLMSSSKRKAIGRETNCLTDSQEKMNITCILLAWQCFAKWKGFAKDIGASSLSQRDALLCI